MDSAPITREEMVELFGSEMPIEAVNLVWNSDGEKTCGELRAELRAIAATRPTADLGEDGELERKLRELAKWLRQLPGPTGADSADEAADRLILYREAVKYAHATLVELKIARTLSEGGVGGAATAVSGVVNKLRAVLSRSGG